MQNLSNAKQQNLSRGIRKFLVPIYSLMVMFCSLLITFKTLHYEILQHISGCVLQVIKGIEQCT